METAATGELRRIAARAVAAAAALGPLEAALLTGSAARGDADFYSDLDLLLYVKELPPVARLDELRAALGGTEPVRFGDRAEDEDSMQFHVRGIPAQLSFTTTARQEKLLAELRERPAGIDSVSQKVLAGLLDGVPLHGETLIDRWQMQARTYPDELRRAAVTRHWRFFPLWWYEDALAARDAELWRVELLLEAAFGLLGVLAGLNRVYYSRFELKRLRALVSNFALAPPMLADRIEALFRLAPDAAAAELGRLVDETRTLVLSELPDAELPLARPPGTRIEPWRASARG